MDDYEHPKTQRLRNLSGEERQKPVRSEVKWRCARVGPWHLHVVLVTVEFDERDRKHLSGEAQSTVRYPTCPCCGNPMEVLPV